MLLLLLSWEAKILRATRYIQHPMIPGSGTMMAYFSSVVAGRFG